VLGATRLSQWGWLQGQRLRQVVAVVNGQQARALRQAERLYLARGTPISRCCLLIPTTSKYRARRFQSQREGPNARR